METAKRSIRDILHFISVATAWQQRPSPNSQLKYAIGRVLKSAQKVNEDYIEQLTELNVKHASMDEKGNILTGAGDSFIFKKDDLNTRNRENRALLDSEVEVGIYFAKAFAELKPFEEAAFSGFVIPEMVEPNMPVDAKVDAPATA